MVLGLAGGSGVGAPFDLLRHNAADHVDQRQPVARHHLEQPVARRRRRSRPIRSRRPTRSTRSATSPRSSPTPRYAIDDSLTTFWYTESYRQANFGGLKTGVGLLIDAGTAVAPSQVTVELPHPGHVVRHPQRRHGRHDARPATPSRAATVATSTTASVPITDKTPHRYWLLWITNLPGSGGNFQSSVTNVALDH